MGTQQQLLWDVDIYDGTPQAIAAVGERKGDSSVLEARFVILAKGQMPFMVMLRRRGSKESFQMFPKDRDAMMVELADFIAANGGRIGKASVRASREDCELLTVWMEDQDFWGHCFVEAPLEVCGFPSHAADG